MAINFPNSPTDGQIFYDTDSGNRYIYSTSKGRWSVASNNSPFTATSNNQVLFNNQNSIDGDNGLVFDVGANTLYANSINVAYDMRVRGNLYIGSNTVTISNNSIAAQAIYVTDNTGNQILVASASDNPSFNAANIAYNATNSAFSVINAAFGHSNATYASVNSAFGVANAVYGQSNNEVTRLSSAYVVANSSYAQVNTVFGVANAAFNTANSISIAPVYNLTNASFDKANSAVVNAAAAYAAVNTLATSANAYAATVGTSTNNYTSATYSTLTQLGQNWAVTNAAFGQSNSEVTRLSAAYVVGNAAFSKANTALPNTSGAVFNGNLGISVAPNFPLDVNGLIHLYFSSGTGAGIWYDGQNSTNRFFLGCEPTGNTFRLWDASAATNRLLVDVNGHMTVGASTRSPIFYDSDDTAYYANLAGASRLSGIQSTGRSGNWNTDFQNTPADSFRYGGDLNAGTNGPTSGTGWWIQQNFRHSNASNYWGVQVAWGWEDRANELYTRNVTGNSFGSWIRYSNSNNGAQFLLGTITATNAGAIQDTSILSTAGYSRFILVIKDTYSITNGTTLFLQFYSGGAFQTASYTAQGTVLTSGGYTGQYLSTASYLSYPSQSSNAHPLYAVIEILNPSNTTYWKPYFGQGTMYSPSNAQSQTYQYGGAWQGGTGAITGFRIYAASGNVTGTVQVYGVV
jgi:hypothetical protein